MKKPHTILVILIIVAVALGSAVVAFEMHASRNDAQANTVSFAPMSANSPGPADSQTPTSASTSAVTIKDFGFGPATITVSKDTTVTWTNRDSVTHTVTIDSGTGPKSGSIIPGNSYFYTFTAPGTYRYHSSLHPEMTGTVLVTN